MKRIQGVQKSEKVAKRVSTKCCEEYDGEKVC